MNLTTETAIENLSAGVDSPLKRATWWDNFKDSNFYLRLTHWEYWPMSVANVPLVMSWAWFALRAGRPFFFSAVNPAIETGGLWGESKFNILKRIPSSHVPPTVFVKQGTDFDEILEKMKDIGLTWPVIAKPDVGERGLLVSIINSEAELRKYISRCPADFLIQKFVDLPLELAVMYHRFPGRESGSVTSVCVKETLKVTGDGHTPVAGLMKKNPRARLQLPRFGMQHPELLSKIPAPGETLELEPIGNHCRGTRFLNGNHHIDTALTAVFDAVARQMEGIHYGRFDLKCRSVEDLRKGDGFMVMEFNGIGAEPAHIYDPDYPIRLKYRDIHLHWRTIYHIYKVQARRGAESMGFGEMRWRLQKYLNYKKRLKAHAAV